MKKINIFLFLIFACKAIFAQDTIEANIDYVNCNYAMANFYYVSDTGFSGAQYCWDFGDGIYHCSTNTSAAFHTYTIPGSYTLTFMLINNGDTTIIIKPNLVIIRNPPTVNFIDSASDSLLFAPLTYSFINQTMHGDGDSLTYTWDLGDSTISHDTNTIHTYLNPGTYDISLSVTDNLGCNMGAGNYVIVKDTAQAGEINYIISQCDNGGPSPCGYAKHYLLQNDTVKVFGYIYDNCCGTKTVTIRFSPDTIHIRKFIVGPLCTCGCGFCFAINIPNITQDSIYVAFDGDVVLVKRSYEGIEESDKINGFTFFPNPTNDNLQVNLQQNAEIKILNIQGQEIKTYTASTRKICIDISSLKSGMYFIKVKTDKEITTKKFIKQ